MILCVQEVVTHIIYLLTTSWTHITLINSLIHDLISDSLDHKILMSVCIFFYLFYFMDNVIFIVGSATWRQDRYLGSEYTGMVSYSGIWNIFSNAYSIDLSNKFIILDIYIGLSRYILLYCFSHQSFGNNIMNLWLLFTIWTSIHVHYEFVLAPVL